MTDRRKRGDETWNRLLNWSEAQKASERLAAHILASEGFISIDPSHPLGGPDGLKDLVCAKGNIRWIAAAYFPRGEHKFSDVRDKFLGDLKGTSSNNARGFAFVTNQYLQVTERSELVELAGNTTVELFHLERIASILDRPANYGIRLEYLDIQMTKEEQVAFFSQYASAMSEFRDLTQAVLRQLSHPDLTKAIPVAQLEAFKSTLESIVGTTGFYTSVFRPPMDRLKVPLTELQEFETILNRITGGQFPQFAVTTPPLARLQSLSLQLADYEQTLDRILWKLEKINKLKPYT